MSIDKEIVEEFLNESKTLITDSLDLLESIEGDFSQVKKLADYGNSVDRIMGGAKSLALMAPPTHAIHLIADYAALCKAVGYKASQIRDNVKFFDICVAMLLDVTENLKELLDNIYEDVSVLKQEIPAAFIERLQWISQQFNESYSMSVGLGATDEKDPGKLDQSEIDDLLKKLGL